MLSYQRMNSKQREVYDIVKNASQWFSLHERQYGDAEAQAIAEALKVNRRLTELNLGWNQIGDAGAKAIAEALKVNRTVTVLGLNENQIGDAGAEVIAETLKVNDRLSVLSLDNNFIAEHGINRLKQVGNTACNPALERQHPPPPAQLQSHAAHAKFQANVSTESPQVARSTENVTQRQHQWYDKVKNASERLNLCTKQIDDAGAQTIAETLQLNTTVRKLDLSNNQIADAGAQAISEALKVNTTMNHIDLGGNLIGEAGAQAIAGALKVNTTPTFLFLSVNQIGDTGAQAIAASLKVNKMLTTLNLRATQIGDTGAQAIGEGLKVNKTLTSLDLSFNRVGDAAVRAIAEALKVNTVVTELYLYYNQIGDAGAQAIAEALKVNKTVMFLKLDRNVISETGSNALQQVGNKTCNLSILNQSTPSPAQLQEMASRAAQVRPSVPTTTDPQVARSAAAGVPHAAPSSSHAPSSPTPPAPASKPRGSANAGPAIPTDSTEEIRQLQARIAQLELERQAPPITSAAPILSTIPRVSLQVLSEATAQFSESKRIGGGGFGSVYSGVWSGQRVAVKRLAADSTQGVAQFEAELEALSRFRHPNIVTIMCYAQEGNERCLVFELMPNGSVRDRLDRKGGTPALSWQQRQTIATSIANAMHFVQTAIPRQPLFHLDLKTDNVLLAADFHAKVADFGLTRSMPAQVDAHSYIRTQTVQGTLQYICPQYHQEGKVSIKTDVYSYGMILLELVTGQQPSLDLMGTVRRELKKSRKIDGVLDKAIDWSPQDKDAAQAMAADLAPDCLEPTRVDRPSFGEILRRLSGEEAGENEEEAVAGSDRECLVCFNAPTNAKLMPCCHACVCVACAQWMIQRQDKCMICRVLPTSFETGTYNQTFVQ
ncbi:hypothetical protein CAOG_09154 [Capsaspora owczarzaki ATCC 30864]|uniref:TKL/IRAK protein kinase n=1 Tax=Capsaspora owczarzaki (strain ATCC 30864) TaxID=595528 RepID=A0A0D2USM6_CAPO3|nr:hypothetical protein CAOG_09154 [Capsaspora owczarzaki ATCC 30864]KJE97966.1 TKL/IRAK protein kinase [Capsaspora owczarzaki ATCC 30864]|eukprot:XP_011270867.1 hypothetical protein CAOG_09154 [Capsaspora owczarzaki ATCC 30864]